MGTHVSYRQYILDDRVLLRVGIGFYTSIRGANVNAVDSRSIIFRVDMGFCIGTI